MIYLCIQGPLGQGILAIVEDTPLALDQAVI